MYATDFIFDGRSLSDFGFLICDFEGSSSLETFEAGVPISFKTVSRKKGHLHSLVDLRYDNALEISFDICKDPCLFGDENLEISDPDFLTLSRWLLRKEYHDLQFINEKHSIPRHYRGIINISKLIADDIIMGLRLVVTTDKPYAYGDPVRATHSFEAGGAWEFPDNSTLIDSTPLNLVITCKESGDLTLTNDLTDTQLIIKNCTANEVLTIDGENCIITTTNNNHEIWDDFNYEFLTIGNTKDNCNNNITSSLACDVTLSYNPVIKDSP